MILCKGVEISAVVSDRLIAELGKIEAAFELAAAVDGVLLSELQCRQSKVGLVFVVVKCVAQERIASHMVVLLYAT